MINLETHNKSFINEYKRLQSKGINADFLLELKDESLKNINPYSDSLTNEEKARIYLEIIRNEWYFIREIVRVPNEDNYPVPYILNQMSAKFFFLLQLNQANILVNCPIHSGRTMMAVIDHIWRTIFSERDRIFTILNTTIIKYKDTYGKMYPKILKSLPEWLLDMSMSEKDKAEADRLIDKQFRNGNCVNALVLPGQAEMAEKFGDGVTFMNWLVDDVEKNNFFQNEKVQNKLMSWDYFGHKVLIANCPRGLSLPISDSKSKYYENLIKTSIIFTDDMFKLPMSLLEQLFKGKFVRIACTWNEVGMNKNEINQIKALIPALDFKLDYMAEWGF